MKKVLLISCGGFDNFGDEAMFKELYKNLSSEKNDVTVAYYNFDVKKTRNRYPGVKVEKILSLPGKLGLLREIIMKNDAKKYAAEYDALFFPGSGNFTSLYSTHIQNIFYLVEAFKKENKYVEFRPQSVGPFFGKRREEDERTTRKIIEFSDKFYVRDAISYEFLNMKYSNVELVNDDAWGIEAILPNEFKNLTILSDKRLVGISIRPFRAQKERLIEWFVSLTEELTRQGYTPFFIPICYSDHSSEYHDNYFLKSALENRRDVIFLEDIINVQNLQAENIKYFISLCEKCIGLSYHFNVFSLAENKNLVSLYYEEYYKVKNLGLQKAFGNIKNVLNPLEQDVGDVMKLLGLGGKVGLGK